MRFVVWAGVVGAADDGANDGSTWMLWWWLRLLWRARERICCSATWKPLNWPKPAGGGAGGAVGGVAGCGGCGAAAAAGGGG